MPAASAATANGHAAVLGQPSANGAGPADDAASASPFTFLPAPEDNNKVPTGCSVLKAAFVSRHWHHPFPEMALALGDAKAFTMQTWLCILLHCR